MPENPLAVISEDAVEAAAVELYVETHTRALRYDTEAAYAMWEKATPHTQLNYRARAYRILSVAHPFIAGPAWAEGHDDGQWNLEHEGMIARGNRTRIENPYPYPTEGR